MSIETADSPFFDRIFDCAIYGSGNTGFSVARSLAARGASIILIDGSGNLLWESSRALENRCEGGAETWQEWLATLKQYNGVNNGYFEAALAEVVAADEICRTPNLDILLYAIPVEAHIRNQHLEAITVATKSGVRLIRSRRWVDASEESLIAKIINDDSEGDASFSAVYWNSVILFSRDWSSSEDDIEAFLASNPECQWRESTRQDERRLMRSTHTVGDFFKSRLLLQDFRKACPNLEFFASHSSTKSFPVYGERATEPEPSMLLNLMILSPAASKDAKTTPGDRFEWGKQASDQVWHLPAAEAGPIDLRLPAPREEITCDVLVCGVGTAGAISALAAARQGADTIALEAGHGPGGVGTAGGIAGYFHGAKGGIQQEVDDLAAEMASAFTGKVTSSGITWHHDAKMQALSDSFEQANVHFVPETILCGVEHDSEGHVLSVLAAKAGKLIRYIAKAFVDSTGDGDLCALAGSQFSLGRLGDGRCLAFSQPSLYVTSSENGFRLHSWNYDAGWVDPTIPEDLTRARIQGIASYLKEDWAVERRPITITPLLGLRQSRHIETDVTLSLGDLVEHRSFPDAIGLTSAVADTHSVDFEFESDEAMFYFWVCRGFRHRLHAEIPYGLLIPRHLQNVWIASRAIGVTVEAAYCLRMQRDIQRVGEAAGIAAALSVKRHVSSRDVDLGELQELLQNSGAKQSLSAPNPEGDSADPLRDLDRGRFGMHLWTIYRAPATYRQHLLERLDRQGNTSFYAAAILAMWGETIAEDRLLAAIETKEIGPRPEEASRGAFGQIVDVPFWILAIALLRICGTERSLPALRKISSKPQPFNVRTTVGLTLERLVSRKLATDDTREMIELLKINDLGDACLPPSRSLWRTALNEEQKPMNNAWQPDIRQDHSWQLQGIFSRISRVLERKEEEGSQQ